MGEDKNAQEAVENVDTTAKPKDSPSAGPHAKKELTDMDKTPGTGSLPDDTNGDADVGSE
jgi:hypothetical protein